MVQQSKRVYLKHSLLSMHVEEQKYILGTIFLSQTLILLLQLNKGDNSVVLNDLQRLSSDDLSQFRFLGLTFVL